MRTCPFCHEVIQRGRFRLGVFKQETDAEYEKRATCGSKTCRYRHSSQTHAHKGRRPSVALEAGWPKVTGEVVADFRPHELLLPAEPGLMVARPTRETFNYHGESSAS